MQSDCLSCKKSSSDEYRTINCFSIHRDYSIQHRSLMEEQQQEEEKKQ